MSTGDEPEQQPDTMGGSKWHECVGTRGATSAVSLTNDDTCSDGGGDSFEAVVFVARQFDHRHKLPVCPAPCGELMQHLNRTMPLWVPDADVIWGDTLQQHYS